MSLSSLRNALIEESGDPAYEIRIESGVTFADDRAADVDRLPNGVFVRLASRLDEDEREQATAHELAHVLIEFRWMEPIDRMSLDLDVEIVRELGNAVSHPHVVRVLADEFDISSALLIAERSSNLSDFASYVPQADTTGEEPLFLGLVLFDIGRIRSDLTARIGDIAVQNRGVERVYRAAEAWLSAIGPRTSREFQRAAIASFLGGVSQ